MNVGETELPSDVEASGRLQPGLNVSIEIDPSMAHLFDDDGDNLVVGN